MSLSISDAATLTSSTIADGDLIALSDISAAIGSKGSHIEYSELRTAIINSITTSTRASLGLATSDSPEFAGINLGHASDTTLARASAGVMTVEGVQVALRTTNTFTGVQTLSGNGAVSQAIFLLTGTVYKAGTSTTNHPLFYINETGATAATNWSTKGTAFGINLTTADSYPVYGDALAVIVDNKRVASIDKLGGFFSGSDGLNGRFMLGSAINSFYHGMVYQNASRMTFMAGGSYVNLVESGGFVCGDEKYFGFADSAPSNPSAVTDTFLMRGAPACIQLGKDAAGVTNQHFKACNRITSDGVGANLTLSGGNGRGDAGGDLIFASYTTAAAATAGTLTTRLTMRAQDGLLTFEEGVNLSFGGTTGSLIGTSTGDKIGFYGATPIGRWAATTAASNSHSVGSGADLVNLSSLENALNALGDAINTLASRIVTGGLMAA